MTGYIVVEPDLRVERVPDRLLESEDILWPADRTTMPEKAPGEPVATFNANELYHRHNLIDDGAVVYVWSRRDPSALPDHVIATIRERAESDARGL